MREGAFRRADMSIKGHLSDLKKEPTIYSGSNLQNKIVK